MHLCDEFLGLHRTPACCLKPAAPSDWEAGGQGKFRGKGMRHGQVKRCPRPDADAAGRGGTAQPCRCDSLNPSGSTHWDACGGAWAVGPVELNVSIDVWAYFTIEARLGGGSTFTLLRGAISLCSRWRALSSAERCTRAPTSWQQRHADKRACMVYSSCMRLATPHGSLCYPRAGLASWPPSAGHRATLAAPRRCFATPVP